MLRVALILQLRILPLQSCMRQICSQALLVRLTRAADGTACSREEHAGPNGGLLGEATYHGSLSAVHVLTPKTQRLDRSWPRQLLWAVPAAINLKDKTSLPLGLLTAHYQSVDSWRPAILCPATQAYCEHGAYVGLRRLPHGSLGEGKSGQTAGAGALLYTVSELSLCRWPGGFCLLSTSMKQQQTNFLACI